MIDSGRTAAAAPGAGAGAGAADRGVRRALDAAAAAELRFGSIEPAHRASIERMLRETGFFRDAEICVALDVIDAFFQHPDRDYSAVGAFTPGGDLIGYVCYGPTPCTNGTFDLYWIAVGRAAQRTGVGTLLLKEMERRLATMDARLVLIETSSQPLYAPTRAFYERRGYREVARVPGFYDDGDDRVIFAKRIRHPSRQGADRSWTSGKTS